MATVNYDDYLFVLFIHRFTMENINITASGPGRFYVSVPPESTWLTMWCSIGGERPYSELRIMIAYAAGEYESGSTNKT